jgi:small-conductance mechanosensitive channel
MNLQNILNDLANIFINDMTTDVVKMLVMTAIFLVLSFIILKLLKSLLKKIITEKYTSLFSKKLTLSFIITVNLLLVFISTQAREFYSYFDNQSVRNVFYIAFLVSLGFFLSEVSNFIIAVYYKFYGFENKNNFSARRVKTKVSFIHRIYIIFIWMILFSLILMTFDGVRKLGTSILASAGIISVVVGFSSQKILSNLIAGVQIAFTQPIKIGDVIVAEGEWGTIEEITLTYVVLDIWDQRRLILPISYFVDNNYENWSRNSTNLLSTVNIYVDYNLPIDPVREKLNEIVEGSKDWDKRVSLIQVTDMNENYMTIRALISSEDSAKAWNLKCLVREELIKFIHENYPECFPKKRYIKQQ